MLIAQITDTHIFAGGTTGFGEAVDTASRLRAAVDCIRALSPQPTVVLATGDLVDKGDPADYAELAELLAPLGMPVFPIPGNHDARHAMRDAFPAIAQRLDSPFIQYAVDDYPVRLVALDTLEEGRIGGRLCAERLAWLERSLDASTRPTVRFMHHPPYDFGAATNADMRCEGGEAMERIVARHANVQAVLCGHLHRSTVQRWGGTVVCSVPATAPTLQVNLDGSHPKGWVDTAPTLGLHLWRNGGLVSHVMSTDEAARFTPFRRKAA